MGFFKSLIKSIVKPDEWQKEQDEKRAEEWRQKAASFYEQAKPIVNKYIDNKGFEYFDQARITIDDKEYNVGAFGWLENQRHKIFSERFQIDTFGELIFDEEHDFGRNNKRSYMLRELDYNAYQFGFCDSKFYLKNRNPYLKFLIEYHKINPEIKITSEFLFTIKIFFENMAEFFVLDKYGQDYYDKPGKLSEDERRAKAWSDEKLHELLNDLSDPNNPDNAACFAKNIGKFSNETAEALIKYEYCQYDDRYEIFFGSKDSKELLSLSEIERNLDSKEE